MRAGAMATHGGPPARPPTAPHAETPSYSLRRESVRITISGTHAHGRAPWGDAVPEMQRERVLYVAVLVSMPVS